MAEQIETTTPKPVSITSHPKWRSVVPNATALPIGGVALTILLRDTIISVEVRNLLGQYATWNEDARVVVVDVYRRMTPSERFRLHNSLHAMLHYVPAWLQEVTF